MFILHFLFSFYDIFIMVWKNFSFKMRVTIMTVNKHTLTLF